MLLSAKFGYIFNSKGNADTHLSNKETETISMMANMGLSVQENNMDRVYIQSLLIIYKKSFVLKLLYGLAGIPVKRPVFANRANKTNQCTQTKIFNSPQMVFFWY